MKSNNVLFTLFLSVYRAFSLAPYFRHCLIQLWMVQSLRYQQFGLWRNLQGFKRKSILFMGKIRWYELSESVAEPWEDYRANENQHY